jgi:hypothetical protein
VADRQAEMMPWLPLVATAVASIAVQLIRTVGGIWQERLSAKSRCDQMRTAAEHDVMLYERRSDGTHLAIVPHRSTAIEGDVVPEVSGSGEVAPQ